MEKRTRKQIENSVKEIQAAAKSAKTFKEISEITGLTPQKVKTSLKDHPRIKKRIVDLFVANKEANVCIPKTSVKKDTSSTKKQVRISAKSNEKHIVICDCPALMYGLSHCIETPIVIPNFVKNSLVGISKSNTVDGAIAKELLARIDTIQDWCTIAPRINETLINECECNWRTRALVALACKYWAEDYQVTVKTRTAEILKVANLQECLRVEFVQEDGKNV